MNGGGGGKVTRVVVEFEDALSTGFLTAKEKTLKTYRLFKNIDGGKTRSEAWSSRFDPCCPDL